MFFVLFFQNNIAKFLLVPGLVKCSTKELGEFLAASQLGRFNIGLMRPENLVKRFEPDSSCCSLIVFNAVVLNCDRELFDGHASVYVYLSGHKKLLAFECGQ